MPKRFREHDKNREEIEEQQGLPVELVNPPLPCRIERRSPRIWLGIIDERVFRIPDPCDSKCKMVTLPSLRQEDPRTKAAKRVVIGKLGPVVRSDGGAVSAGSEAFG